MSHVHGRTTLAIVPLDAVHARIELRGRTDLTVHVEGCELVADALSCEAGLDGARVSVDGLSATDVVLARLGDEGAVLTAASPGGVIRTALSPSSFPYAAAGAVLFAIAIALARPRTASLPRVVVSYVLGGIGVWLLLLRLGGS